MADHLCNRLSKCLDLILHDLHINQTCTMDNDHHTIPMDRDQRCSTQALMPKLHKWRPGKARKPQLHNRTVHATLHHQDTGW